MQTTWKPWQPKSLSYTCGYCGTAGVQDITFDGFNTGRYYCENEDCENCGEQIEATDNEELLQTL